MIPISPVTTIRTANERCLINSRLSRTADLLSIGSVAFAGIGGVCGKVRQYRAYRTDTAPPTRRASRNCGWPIHEILKRDSRPGTTLAVHQARNPPNAE